MIREFRQLELSLRGRFESIKSGFLKLSETADTMGMTVNHEKTKYMQAGRKPGHSETKI